MSPMRFKQKNRASLLVFTRKRKRLWTDQHRGKARQRELPERTPPSRSFMAPRVYVARAATPLHYEKGAFWSSALLRFLTVLRARGRVELGQKANYFEVGILRKHALFGAAGPRPVS